MPNVELMRLYDTYLGPASDTRLDLGASNFRWDDLYIRGTNSSTTLSSSSTNAAVLTATSAHIAGLASTGITVSTGNFTFLLSTSSHLAGFASTGATVNSGTITVLTVTSSTTTSGRFTRSVGSSLTLSNSANAYLNVRMLTHNAASLVSGDVYFFASSNRVYLAISSITSTYFVAMDT